MASSLENVSLRRTPARSEPRRRSGTPRAAKDSAQCASSSCSVNASREGRVPVSRPRAAHSRCSSSVGSASHRVRAPSRRMSSALPMPSSAGKPRSMHSRFRASSLFLSSRARRSTTPAAAPNEPKRSTGMPRAVQERLQVSWSNRATSSHRCPVSSLASASSGTWRSWHSLCSSRSSSSLHVVTSLRRSTNCCLPMPGSRGTPSFV
mmetsp:Transcript_42062/g.132418  ORF Transcript_42062/g.132418 Transcript_42062/m.132418 type:complete len:207 (+) Transcript_42062:353-973(+)